MAITDFVCYREFSELLNYVSKTPVTTKYEYKITQGSPERYIELFRLITKNNAYLVSEWLRVGYVQGNMNSDNTLLAGRTIDYGPFGWLEKFNPLYQPFTSDPSGNFAFMKQPTAMNVNIGVLGS